MNLIIFIVLITPIQSVYVSLKTYNKSLFFHTWLPKAEVIQPDRFEHMEIYSMYLHPSESYERPYQTIKVVRMMLQLELLHISNFSLGELPSMVKLPKLRKLAIIENDITELKNNSFDDLPILKLFLSGNKIQQIEEKTFKANLQELYLNCNNLTELSARWFVTPEKLEILNIFGNYISHLKEDSLKEFLGLKALDLSLNKMITLGPKSLEGPKSMDYLSLAYNNLTSIPENVLEYNNTIQYLDITYNRLTFLKMEFLDKLNLKRFEIRGNPWQCPCYNKIEQWMIKKGVMVTELKMLASKNNDINCIYANSFSKFCIELYDDELYKKFSIQLMYNFTRKSRCEDCDKFVLYLFFEMKGVFKLPPSKYFYLGNY